jgi:glyoxylase-like metal-dependent hydrolase (beta-lactamase superfamily II)
MVTRMRKDLRAFGVIAALTACSGILAGTRHPLSAAQGPQTPAPRGSGTLEVIQVRPDFFMIVGAGGNIAVQTGDDGAIVVDTGAGEHAENVVATIRSLSPQPIRYIINTGAAADHIGGNARVARSGRTIFNTGNALGAAMTNNGAASILAHEGVLRRMSAPTGQVSPFPGTAWPTETFESGRKSMFMNGEAIEVLHQPAARSTGDSMVMFRRSDVVVAGDIYDTISFPIIDVSNGGSINGEIAALNRLVELAVSSTPLIWKEGGTYVIPGHGFLSDQTDVVEYRDMVTIIRDRVQAMIAANMTLPQVLTANPAQGYATRYAAGAPTTARAFVESVYASLSRK